MQLTCMEITKAANFTQMTSSGMHPFDFQETGAPTVQMLSIDEIAPYVKNTRTHPPNQINQLAASIKKFGFTNPILIGTNNTIIAGHGRFAAAKQLGLIEVPTISLAHLSTSEQKAYVIADNKLSDMSGWDDSILESELESIADELDLSDPDLANLFSFDAFTLYKVEQLSVTDIKPHPRNYKDHPEDQIAHIQQSIKEHGIYRNIIIAKDGTILAGHGVTKAAISLGIKNVPCLRLNIEPTSVKALKLLAADNEVSHLGTSDDRTLSNILKQILEDDDLLGTGYDEKMLANLLFVTRSASEISSFDAAAEWVGMPEYEGAEQPMKCIVSFKNETDKAKFCDLLGIAYNEKLSFSTWYPFKDRQDLSAVRLQG